MENKLPIWSISAGVVVALFIMVILILGAYDDEKKDNYCSGIYPSKIESVLFDVTWSETIGIEKGHIKCCRYFYQNHERQTECKIFPYKK